VQRDEQRIEHRCAATGLARRTGQSGADRPTRAEQPRACGVAVLPRHTPKPRQHDGEFVRAGGARPAASAPPTARTPRGTPSTTARRAAGDQREHRRLPAPGPPPAGPEPGRQHTPAAEATAVEPVLRLHPRRLTPAKWQPPTAATSKIELKFEQHQVNLDL